MKNGRRNKGIIIGIAIVLAIVAGIAVTWRVFGGFEGGFAGDLLKPEATETSTFTAGEKPVANELIEVKLERVVDGDTVVVWLDGDETRVRFLCVDCEESVHADETKNTEKGREASEFTKEYLKDYETIYLQFDVELYDRYDRVLAYIWLDNHVDVEDEQDIRQYMFNAILLEEDMAEVVQYGRNRRYVDLFRRIETE